MGKTTRFAGMTVPTFESIVETALYLQVACPTCKAGAGTYCTTDTIHPSRQKLRKETR